MASEPIQSARDQVSAEVALKLKSEAQLAFTMRRLMRDIATDARKRYAAEGSVLNVSDFESEIATILTQHYRRLSRQAAGQVTSLLDDGDDKELAEAAAEEAVREFVQTMPAQRAAEITKTNQQQLDRSFENVIIGGAIAGAALSRGDIAKKASKDFQATAVSRATNVIAPTETQNAVEGSKEKELLAVAAAIPLVAGEVLEKEWMTVLDGREREAHHNADGQTVQAFQPFIVGGEQLMRPGDTSLGASLKNVINCRCSSITRIKKRD